MSEAKTLKTLGFKIKDPPKNKVETFGVSTKVQGWSHYEHFYKKVL